MDIYKLTPTEISKLNDFTVFLSYFYNKSYISSKSSISNYRKYIIETISKKYKPDEFYFYETILNKIIHNIINNTTNANDYLTLNLNINKYNRSFSNKKLLVDENNKIIYCVTDKDYINKYRSIVNKNLIKKFFSYLEKYIPIDTKLINDLSGVYYPLDYPFPNVNYLYYNQNKKTTWIRNIKRMYYMNKSNDIWYNNHYIEEFKKILF